MVLRRIMRMLVPKTSLTKLAQLSNRPIIHITSVIVMLLLTNIAAAISCLPSAIPQDSIAIDSSYSQRRSYQNLEDSYSGDEFIYERSVQETGWWIRFKRWLSDLFKNLFEINSDAQASELVDLAMNAFYTLLIIFVVFFIVKAIMNREGSWIFAKSSNKKIVSVSDLETNIQDTDFSQLIGDAEADNNYRTAIRYYYLWSLKNLSNKGLIDYDVEKTNSDYLLELRSDPLIKKFSYASYLYNYIWYGEFEIDAAQYAKAKQTFVQLMTTEVR